MASVKEVGPHPAVNDSVSSISWNPRDNYFVATTWSGQVRCWQADNHGNSAVKLETKHAQPGLCSTWQGDGSAAFVAGCNKVAMRWDFNSNMLVPCAEHAAPIKSVVWSNKLNCLITGSWDRKIKYWDIRQKRCATTVDVPERVYSMDANDCLFVAVLAQRGLCVYDLTNHQKPFKSYLSPLKHQSRCVSVFADATGFAVGSIGGQVAVEEVTSKKESFTFKCHRKNGHGLPSIYAVNGISFHRGYGTLVTYGSDGTYAYWDKDSRQRLIQPRNAIPRGISGRNNSETISAGNFNANGSLFAFASSYDWSRGIGEYKQHKNRIFIEKVMDKDIKSRPRPKGRR